MNFTAWLTTGAIGLETAAAQFVEYGLGKNTAGRVSGAQKQYVELLGFHRFSPDLACEVMTSPKHKNQIGRAAVPVYYFIISIIIKVLV